MGRIIPAVVTTTAAVDGLVGLELYKVVGGPRPRHAFRHSYLHLAENYFSRWVPKAPDIQKVSPGHLTCTRPEFSLHLPKQALLQLQALVGRRLWESPQDLLQLPPCCTARLGPVRHRKQPSATPSPQPSRSGGAAALTH